MCACARARLSPSSDLAEPGVPLITPGGPLDGSVVCSEVEQGA